MVSEFEARKDMVQEAAESVAVRVGRIATIITTCVRDVTREVGDLITDSLEMRDAVRRAREDGAGTVVDGEVVEPRVSGESAES